VPGVFQEVAELLEREGFLVAAPDMPWSRSRYLDATLEAALEEIAVTLQALQAKGAPLVVLGGHSMGAVAALAYAAARGGVAGLIMSAPGHFPDYPGFHRDLGDSLARALKMVKTGRGHETGQFLDRIMGRISLRAIKARVYVSFFSPEGPMAPGRNAARLSPDIPVLCLLGSNDPLSPRAREHVLARLPFNPLSRVLTITGEHMEVPGAAQGEILAWLKTLPQ
jgi:pimeloyl-ACP methyl ester carboxylesterase